MLNSRQTLKQKILDYLWEQDGSSDSCSLWKGVDGRVKRFDLQCALDELEQEDKIKRILGEPAPERGGYRRVFYHLTAQGVEGLMKR